MTTGNAAVPEHAADATLVDLAAVPGSGGVVWSISPQGFHTNLVVLDPHKAIDLHRNDSVDVLVVVLAGDGTATVGGRKIALVSMSALLIERGTARSISAGPSGLRYLTVHDERGPLTITPRQHGPHV